MAKKKETGHRQRLRERFLAGEAGACSDETLLELLLTYAIRRKDVRPLAHELIRAFGSLSLVLSASPEELWKVKGVGQSSVALLKAVNFIRSSEVSKETKKPTPKGAAPVQQKLFQLPSDEQSGEAHEPSRGAGTEKPSVPSIRLQKGNFSTGSNVVNMFREPREPSQPSEIAPSEKKSVQRKFQVSNAYLLEFDQLARILHFLMEHRDAGKINRKALQEYTGLADRQVESMVSMGSAMGLIKPRLQVLTPVGLLIAEHDIFFEKRGTLEWCHYAGAGSFRNLIWFEIFNRLLAQAMPMSQEEWKEQLRSDLTGKYSKRTLGKGLYEEVRFVADAYTKRNFSKLELLNQSSDERLYRRRYTDFAPLVLSAMIYDFCASRDAHLAQVDELAVTPGSPALVFGLDAATLRQQLEELHSREWLRYETTHNLDQIRLKPGFSALEFLTAYFENREPVLNDDLGMMNDE